MLSTEDPPAMVALSESGNIESVSSDAAALADLQADVASGEGGGENVAELVESALASFREPSAHESEPIADSERD